MMLSRSNGWNGEWEDFEGSRWVVIALNPTSSTTRSNTRNNVKSEYEIC